MVEEEVGSLGAQCSVVTMTPLSSVLTAGATRLDAGLRPRGSPCRTHATARDWCGHRDPCNLRAACQASSPEGHGPLSPEKGGEAAGAPPAAVRGLPSGIPW